MNCIATLNEYGQKAQVQVYYEAVDVAGLDHIRTFTMRAIVDGIPYPEGVGKNKREAKENAAQKALENLQRRESSDFQCWLEEHSQKTGVTPVESARVGSFSATNINPENMRATPTKDLSSDPLQSNYIGILNTYCQLRNLTWDFKLIEKRGPPHTPEFVYKAVIGQDEYPEGCGKSAKEAKQKAAQLAWKNIDQPQWQSQVIKDSDGHNTTQEASNISVSDLSINSENMRATPTKDLSCDPLQSNYIGILNDYCQLRKLTCDFKLIEKRGPPHDPEFVYKAVIGQDEYPEGCGKSAREAKQKAAQLAWKNIDQPQWHSQVSGKSSFSEDESSSIAVESEDIKTSTSKATSASHSIIFEDSSKNSPKAVPAQHKAKRRLAPNFNNAPDKNKEAGPNLSTGLTCQTPIQSRFREEFDSIERIGKGAFGRVFKARHICDEKFYAVKIVKDREKSRREAKALAKLEHPNIVRYHNSWIENTPYGLEGSDTSSTSNSGNTSTTKFLYIQMELCEGNTLSEWLKERNKNTIPRRRQDALVITLQIVQAVAYVHSQDLIHRDLKPKNILFSRNNEVKIGDFGLVTVADIDDDDENPLERTKRTGTEVYMSPEQMNQPQYNGKVDIFALGLIYFELLWKMGTRMEKYEVFDGIRNNSFPQDFCAQFSVEHKLIERMVCHDPVKRPDAKDLIPELENFRILDQCNNNNNNNTGRKLQTT